MKLVDIIAILIGALALTSLLSREPRKAAQPSPLAVAESSRVGADNGQFYLQRSQKVFSEVFQVIEEEENAMERLFGPERQERNTELTAFQALCHTERVTYLRMTFEIVSASAQPGENAMATLTRFFKDTRRASKAWDVYRNSAKWRATKAELDLVNARLNDRKCPKMSAEEERRFFIEYFRYLPPMLEAGRRFYPESFGDIQPH